MGEPPQWIEIQKVSFTRWANSYLCQRGLQIDEIGQDLQDGVLLINLLELLTDIKLPRYNKKPRIGVQRLANLNVALDFMKAQGFKLVNVGAVDIENGNIKIILGLLWTTILKYQIQKSAQHESKSPSSQSAPPPEEDSVKTSLLRWVNEQVKPYACPEVKNFTSSFQDGRVLMALTDSMAPGTLDMASFTSHSLSNVTAALQVAETEFGIPMLFEPETVVNSPDEHGMMAYISFFQHYKATHLFHVHPELTVDEEEPELSIYENGGQNSKRTSMFLGSDKRESLFTANKDPTKRESSIFTTQNLTVRETSKSPVMKQRGSTSKKRESLGAELFLGTKVEQHAPIKVEDLMKRGSLLAVESKHDDPGTPKRKSYSSYSDREPRKSWSERRKSWSERRPRISFQNGKSEAKGEDESEVLMPWMMDFPDKFTDVKEEPVKNVEQIRREEERLQTSLHEEAIKGLPVADLSDYPRSIPELHKPRVEFTVGCIALPKQGFRSKTNPMVGLFEIAGEKLLLVDTTEVLMGDHDPVFAKPLVVRYANDVTDKHKKHKLVVWHVEAGGHNKLPTVSDKHVVGYADVLLPNISSIPSQKVLRLPLNSLNDKLDKKLKTKHACFSIARRYAGLRMGHIEGANLSRVRKGSRVDVRVSVVGQESRNPLVAIFELGSSKQTVCLLGKTEWILQAGREVHYRSRISLYDQGGPNTQRWLRVCLYNVVSPGKKVFRGPASRVPTPVQEKDLIGFRDITMHELLVALQTNQAAGLSYPFFGVAKQPGKGFFSLRGRIFNEITDVQFVGVAPNWIQNHTGHELEVVVRCNSLMAVEEGRSTDPTNPVAALFEKNDRGEFQLVGQTEWQKSDNDPIFTRKFLLYSDLHSPSEYRLNVYDLDMAAFDEQQDLKGNTNYMELPTLTAVDGMLTTEPALVGVMYFNLDALVTSAALGGLVTMPLTYPVAAEQGIVKARGEHAVKQAQARVNAILTKKASVTLDIQVYRTFGLPGAKPHEETPNPNSVCTIVDLGVKEASQVGHEITIAVSAHRLPKFDWNCRGDPMVALLERVPVEPDPPKVERENKVEAPSKVETPSKVEVPSTWTCPACTFQNKAMFLACEMCNTNRPEDIVVAEQVDMKEVREVRELPKSVWHDWRIVGQTEWIADESDPVFKKPLSICFDPAKDSDKELRFAVYDVDSTAVFHEDLIGYADFPFSRLAEWADDAPFALELKTSRPEVATLIEAKHSQLTLCAHLNLASEHRVSAIKSGAALSFLGLRREKSAATRELIVGVGAQNLLKLNWNVRNPVLMVLKESEPGKFDVLVDHTEFVAKARGECVFPTSLHLPFESLTQVFRFVVCDVQTANVSLEHDLMGFVDVSYQQLAQVATPFKELMRLDGMLIGGSSVAGAPKWQLRVYMQNTNPGLQDSLNKRKSGLCFVVQEKSGDNSQAEG